VATLRRHWGAGERIIGGSSACGKSGGPCKDILKRLSARFYGPCELDDKGSLQMANRAKTAIVTGAAPPEILRNLISSTRALTGCPFAVNFIIETTAFGPLATDAHLRVCIEERVPAVVFHWAPPPVEWVRMLKEANHSCTQKFSVVFSRFRLCPSREVK
jgi:hypothetical protein